MTTELAARRMEYWMIQLDLYAHHQAVAAARWHGPLARCMKRLGMKVPKRPLPRDDGNTRYVVALDDWFGNYRENRVSVTWHPKSKAITVWGDDDFGMAKPHATKEEWTALISHPISQRHLRSIGFTQD